MEERGSKGWKCMDGEGEGEMEDEGGEWRRMERKAGGGLKGLRAGGGGQEVISLTQDLLMSQVTSDPDSSGRAQQPWSSRWRYSQVNSNSCREPHGLKGLQLGKPGRDTPTSARELHPDTHLGTAP